MRRYEEPARAMNPSRELTRSWLFCRHEPIGSALTTGPDRDWEALPCCGLGQAACSRSHSTRYHRLARFLKELGRAEEPGPPPEDGGPRLDDYGLASFTDPRVGIASKSPRIDMVGRPPLSAGSSPWSNDASQDGAGHDEEEDARRQGAQGGLN